MAWWSLLEVNFITCLVVLVVLAASVAIIRRPGQLGSLTRFLMFTPALLGLLGYALGYREIMSLIQSSGAMADPQMMARGMARLAAMLVLGVLGTLLLGVEALLAFAISKAMQSWGGAKPRV